MYIFYQYYTILDGNFESFLSKMRIIKLNNWVETFGRGITQFFIVNNCVAYLFLYNYLETLIIKNKNKIYLLIPFFLIFLQLF